MLGFCNNSFQCGVSVDFAELGGYKHTEVAEPKHFFQGTDLDSSSCASGASLLQETLS